LTEEPISLRELKELARKYLKSDSVTRNLILSEPDYYIPGQEALAKVKVFSKLLWQSLLDIVLEGASKENESRISLFVQAVKRAGVR
jgi:hypothetical protein